MVRYFLGRCSYAVSTCTDWLVAHWAELPRHAQYCIQRDVEDAWKEDMEWGEKQQAEAHSSWGPLGMDCDRSRWAEVRELWAGPGKQIEWPDS